jgi:hypothetical protein
MNNPVMVEVIDANNTRLSPTRPQKARKLIKRGLATIYSVNPFIIKLVWIVENPDIPREEAQECEKTMKTYQKI